MDHPTSVGPRVEGCDDEDLVVVWDGAMLVGGSKGGGLSGYHGQDSLASAIAEQSRDQDDIACYYRPSRYRALREARARKAAAKSSGVTPDPEACVA